MSPKTFSFPTKTRFGAGTLAELPGSLASLGIRRPLVVTDSGLAKTDAFHRLTATLGESGRGREWFVFDGVHPNPIEDDVRLPAALFREQGCDGVIAIGGGSPLDAGKAARLLAKHPTFPLAKFYDQPADWSGLAPLIAIPTTAGTGSEVGRSSVITLDATRRKAVLFHPELLAKLVILDPELTTGLPPKLTAATGADALTHCIESYTCPDFHPMCDGIALEGIRLVVEALPRAYRDGTDLDARGKMLVAAAMGAVAFPEGSGSRPFAGPPAVDPLWHAPWSRQCPLPGRRDELQRAPETRPVSSRGHRLRTRCHAVHRWRGRLPDRGIHFPVPCRPGSGFKTPRTWGAFRPAG